ncbi:MAG: hypothetical protein IPH07_25770 [Deltaproteobacteria bacterium]|nr:hypothetical protein [Deltaproteobacteria bacterium]MBK8240551.1 hypothetical protein [Deltaproteobacteria bacterium]MBK8718169.1 hypothetical protein [Deltaproteobacteria bacterium]
MGTTPPGTTSQETEPPEPHDDGTAARAPGSADGDDDAVGDAPSGDAPRASDDAGDASAPSATPRVAAAAAASAATSAGTGRRRLFGAVRWWWFLVAALVLEFWIYGRRGSIEVCVGKQGETDFALVGQERTDANRWKFPRCERADNLGLVSKYDQAVKEAIHTACRGATIFRHQGEGKVCVDASTNTAQGWVHRIETRQVLPWERPFYEHLFWFLM